MKKLFVGLTAVVLGLTSFSVALAGPFPDVADNYWAAPAVEWTFNNHVMTGQGNTGLFDPAGLANRAQMATVLFRLNDVFTTRINALQTQVNTLQTRVNDLTARVQALENGQGTTLTASLNGQNEVPPVATQAAGTGTFTLNGNNLTYTINVQGLSSPITGAHFHPGAVGQEGNPIQNITFTGNTATGTWNNMTQQQITDLQNGNIYVNVHTTNFPDGEIRGQVTAS